MFHSNENMQCYSKIFAFQLTRVISFNRSTGSVYDNILFSSSVLSVVFFPTDKKGCSHKLIYVDVISLNSVRVVANKWCLEFG